MARALDPGVGTFDAAADPYGAVMWPAALPVAMLVLNSYSPSL